MKLCYIEKNFAYFTSDFDKQWGDDWNDTPYEHNAGIPYEHETELKIVAFMSDLETPGEIFYPNSPFSVEEINEGKTPWLHGYSYKLDEDIEIYAEIYAGISIEDFCNKIIAIGGRVFVEYELKE